MTTLLQMLMDNPRGWGNGPAPQEVAWQDDAGNLYGFDNKVLSKGAFPEQPQSWGETALNVATAPARIATALAGSLSPYGEQGWQVPPMAHEFADAISAPGRAYSEGMSPEEMQRTAASAAGFAMGGGGLAAGRAPMVAANASKEAGAVGLGNALSGDGGGQLFHGMPGKMTGDKLDPNAAGGRFRDGLPGVWLTPQETIARGYAGPSGSVVSGTDQLKNALMVDGQGQELSHAMFGKPSPGSEDMFTFAPPKVIAGNADASLSQMSEPLSLQIGIASPDGTTIPVTTTATKTGNKVSVETQDASGNSVHSFDFDVYPGQMNANAAQIISERVRGDLSNNMKTTSPMDLFMSNWQERQAQSGHDGARFSNVRDFSQPPHDQVWSWTPGTIGNGSDGFLYSNSSKEAGALGMLAPYLEKEQKKRGGK